MKSIKNLKDKANSLYIKLGVAMTTSPLLSTIVLAADETTEEAKKKAEEAAKNVKTVAPEFAGVVSPVVELLNSLMTPLLTIVGAVGALYCVLLGVKFAKAEEPQDREKAKTHLKNAIIGFVLIFVLILMLRLLMPVMIKWVNDNAVAKNVTGIN